MKTISLSFSKGTQYPARLGTLTLRPASEGRMAYSQNVDVSSDEYGYGVAVPGPALTTIGNNSELTGVPFVRTHFNYSVLSLGYIYFGQTVLGTKTVLRRIKNVLSGSTPVIDTDWSSTINHSSHSNLEIVDMVYRPDSNNNFYVYVAVKDDTDTAVYKFDAADTSPSPSVVTSNVNFTGGYTNQFLVLSSFDNNLYWIGKTRVSSIDTSDSYTVAKLSLGLPLGTYATCGVDWQQQLVIASANAPFGAFSQRKTSGKSNVAVWDYISPGITRNIPAPCRYISALVNAPDGSLLVFGGVDEGKSAIYTFTGYGFNLLVSYIGDMPYSRHSIEFDSQGRILWQTVDGQLCRFDRSTGIFEHLGSITTGSSAGGMLARGIGSPVGNEFFVASGSGSTYTLKKVQFGSYLGDGNSTDGVATPLAVTGIQTLPQGSSIHGITLHLAKSLATGEKLEVRVYQNGSTDYVSYMTLDFTNDGTISSKKETMLIPDVNSFSIGVAWKMTDGNTTAPPVLSADVEVESQY